MSALAELVVKVIGDTTEFESAMEKAGGSMDTVGSKIGAAGAAIGTAVVAGAAVAGAALVGLGVTSIGIASDFQSSMAVMSTAVDPVSVGATDAAGAMEILGAAALAVGSDTQLVGVSASGAAEAITGLYKAGMSTSEIFGDLNGYLAGTSDLSGALRASVDLAAASELDMVAASELAAVTLATFGGELTTSAERADFVNSAMNNFVQTADASVASVQSLADAFVNVGPTAASMGMGVETVNTALAIMSTRGIQGAEAGTQLKSMLLGMQADAAKAGGAMESLGVSMYTAEGAMRPLPDVLADLGAAMAGMTEQQRNQTVATIAGSYGMNAMNALLGEGAAGWTEMEGAIAGAATMQDTAAAKAATFSGVMESLGGVVESFRIEVGSALLPALTSMAELGGTLMEKYGPSLVGVFEAIGTALAGGATAIADFIAGFESGTPVVENVATLITNLATSLGLSDSAAQGLGTAFTNVTTAVTPFVTTVAGFVSSHGPQLQQVLLGIGVALGAFVIISTVVGWITGLVGAFTAAGAAITAAGGGLTGIVALLGGPVTLVIGAVAALVGLLAVAWQNNWGGIQEKTAAAWAAIQAAVGAGLAWLQTNVMAIVGAVVAWWNSAWPTIQATAAAAWNGVQSVISMVVGIIGPTVQGMIETIRGAFANAGPIVEQFKGLWQSLGPLFQALQPVVTVVLGALGAAFAVVFGVIVGVVNGIIGAMGPLVAGIMGAIDNVIGIFTGLITFVTGMWNTIVGLFTGNSQLVQQGIQQMGDGVVQIWTNLVNGIISLAEGLVGAVIGFVTGLVDGVISFFTNLYQTLVGGSIVPDMVNAIVEWFNQLNAFLTAIVSAIQTFIEGVWNALLAVTTAIWEGIKSAIEAAITAAQGIISAVWAAVQAFWEAVWGAILGVTQSIWEGIKSAIEAAITAAQGIISAVWAAVQAFWEAVWAAILGVTQSIWDGIKSAIETAIGAVQGIVESVSSAIQGTWDSFVESLKGSWDAGWASIKSIIEAAKTTLTGIANAIVSAIFGAFNQDWGSIGRGIVDGIGNALKAGLSWVAEQARKIAQAALDAAMDALGIGSPSKEFGWLGEMSVEGYTRPFRNVRPIEKAVVRAMGAGLAAGGRGNQTGGGVDRSVRIGQVVLPAASGVSALEQMRAYGS